MEALLNGEAVDRIPLDSRALNFGDGLFETVLVVAGKPMWLEQHLQRLRRGCSVLAIELDEVLLIAELKRLLDSTTPFARLKIIVSRSAASRPGFVSESPARGDRLLSIQKCPGPRQVASSSEGLSLDVAAHRLSSQPTLAGLKHLNALDYVMAARGLAVGEERLLLDQKGRIVEATCANVFALYQGQLLTPAIQDCGVKGVVRDWVIETFAAVEGTLTPEHIEAAELVFTTNSIRGIVPVRQFRDHCWLLNEDTVSNRVLRDIQAGFRQEIQALLD